ncbi:MAG: hemolysin family protein [Simkaniaceae bacterium]|nr:hemolysin family protein [Simkaniaceae bacterium]
MESNWLFFGTLTILFLFVQAFYSMMEMACVSFNRVRLLHFLSQGSKKARWLSYLLSNPSRLFGTTLIGVNVALQFGSECSRRFYAGLGLSPDWAPITQIILVVLFAELSPMFAARRFPESVAMLGMRLIYYSSIVMRPFIWLLDSLCNLITRLFGLPSAPTNYLTREELQKAIEAREERMGEEQSEEFDTLVSNIFGLRNQSPRELMHPIEKITMLSSHAKVKDLKAKLQKKHLPFYPVYHESKDNITGIVYPRDLLRVPDESNLRDHARSPWFITEKNSIFQIIKQFRWNNQHLAVVLSDTGTAIGILTLDAIIDEILTETHPEKAKKHPRVHVDRTYCSDTPIADINKELQIDLTHSDSVVTLEDLMTEVLGHHPSKGELIRTGDFELLVDDAPLLGDKTIIIRNL